MKSHVALCLLFPLLVLSGRAAVDASAVLPLATGQLELVPSFESCSFYFRLPDETSGSPQVQFRTTGAANWQDAFAPVSDLPTGIWKGSVFNLTEDTAYELRVINPSGAEILIARPFRTWTSHPPIAKTIDLSQLPAAAHGLVITDHGKPDGWIKYTAPSGWRVERASDPNDAQMGAITLRQASYVILENLTIVGGARHAILVDDCDSVRVLNCDVSGWGRVGVQQFTNDGARGKYADAKGQLINLDGGIEIVRSARTVVERCYAHDPRGRANSWMYSHPAGPEAMHVDTARGSTVVRWNDFIGSDEHRWNDVIESSNNSAMEGGFYRDADISGNFLAFGNDDGVELEGGGMNVRFFRNKIEGTTCSISTGACILGPQFVFENLVTNPGDETGLALWFLKNSHGAEQGGKRHFINNTLFGAVPGAYGSYGKPIGTQRIGYMRNNIFFCSPARKIGEWARRDDFDGDIFWTPSEPGLALAGIPSRISGTTREPAMAGAATTPEAAHDFLQTFRGVGQETHGAAFDPKFVASPQADFHLTDSSPAQGRALPVANLVTAGANAGAFANDATDLPYRPLPLVAAPRQVVFAAPKSAGPVQVRLSVPASARESLTFEIRQNRVFDWFKVEPASGRIAPGQELTLQVTLDPGALHGRPVFRGAFLVRMPNGLSRPITVYAKGDFTEDLHPASAPDSMYIEAAKLAGLGSLAQPNDAPNIVGGKVVPLIAPAAPDIVVPLNVPKAGKYSLLVRAGITRDVMQKRIFSLSLDEGTAERVAINADYEWNTDATDYRVVYLCALGSLSAGEHRLRLKLTAGELNLNELIVTDAPAEFSRDTWQRGRHVANVAAGN